MNPTFCRFQRQRERPQAAFLRIEAYRHIFWEYIVNSEQNWRKLLQRKPQVESLFLTPRGRCSHSVKEVIFERGGRTRKWTGSEVFLAPCTRHCVLPVSRSSDSYFRHGKDLSSFEYGDIVDIGHIYVENQRVFERAEGIDRKDCWFDLVPLETQRQIWSLPSFPHICWYEQSL